MGGPNQGPSAGRSGACQSIGDEPTCEKAFHRDQNGNVASCAWDGSVCRGCGPGGGGGCINTCVLPPPCLGDPNRTVFAGGPGINACMAFGTEGSCEEAWHKTFFGTAASCFWDGFDCRGCGGLEGIACTNTCSPPPVCLSDPNRTLFVGGPEQGACQALGNEPTCESAFHRGFTGTASSCFWDPNTPGCFGCGPGGSGQSSGVPCTDTCP